MRRSTLIPFVAAVLGAAAAHADEPPLHAPALKPRTPPAPGAMPETGYSAIEGRYVYAPPDEGDLFIPMQVGAGPNELAIETPELCDGEAWVKIKYSKKRNKVTVKIHATGMPYRPSYTRGRDVSTAVNHHLMTVEDARWQLWLFGDLLMRDTIFYYDALTTDLVGSEYDFPDGPPPGAFPVVIPAARLWGTPLWEGDPDGNVDVELDFDYDRMIDGDGGNGTIGAFVPPRLCEPDRLSIYYYEGALPDSDPFNFDEFLHPIWAGYGNMVATSAEPYPKPPIIHHRDNTMIAHIGTYPQTMPKGYTLDLRGNTVGFKLKEDCGVTHDNDNWPGPYFNFCPTP